MGWTDTVYGWGNYLPKDPAGTPFVTGDSSNPFDILTGKSSLGPEKASTANLDAQRIAANNLSAQLGGERANYATHYNPSRDEWLAAQQSGNIRGLEDAAAGRVASPAELQLQRMAGLNAARQFGLAAALQGRNPGAALRSARLGSIATQSGANLDAAVMRAKEQETARNALVQALQSARGQGQNLLSLDNEQQRALLDAQLRALGIGTDAAGSQFKAENTNAAAQNQFNSDVGGSIVKGIVGSDRRLKTDVKPRDMTKLAGALKGYSFKYKDEKHGEGERVGVMAQDVAKGGKAGKLMLRRMPEGKMGLDVGNAVGAALAMSAQALREARKAA